MKRRVVVTGLGALTPIGLSTESFWDAMMAGKTGAAPITYFDPSDYDTRFACELKGFVVTNYMDKKVANRMDKFTQYGMAATEMAIKDSGIDLEKVDRDMFGVVFGSGIGGMSTFDAQFRILMAGGPGRVSPFFIPMLIPDIAAGQISIRYGLKGPNYATVSACATASHAIGDAFLMIANGYADYMVCGGSEAPVTPMGVAGFNASRAMSQRNDAPEKASRPFDIDRDGFVMGEGGGALILESYDGAIERGAKIYAEIAGLGFTGDAYHLTAPPENGEGAVRSMRMALKDSGIKPTDVQHINMHATSTPLGDIAETNAIKTVFGDHAKTINISATKSMTGHLLGAAGAIESIACILAIKHGKVPPTINLDNPDPKCDLNYTPHKPVDRDITYALNNTFGFGGHNASIIFKKVSN